uniref:Uncharacterized protein n=1 Tax=Pristionchus pacificus TaxID=54126 RepID=A0A2A6BLI1_PRIPA|eukprot:PDM66759.1 hypothetical protein PRIPAC_48176 [Pristionchus pacificus]
MRPSARDVLTNPPTSRTAPIEPQTAPTTSPDDFSDQYRLKPLFLHRSKVKAMTPIPRPITKLTNRLQSLAEARQLPHPALP